ncbi:hypothetical protein U5801_19905 [Lamprobacter modestohalophilus]|uniref:hypothetical protein n=1 Tax=Lamprobacter modestohalophilus TaxID=1064514 RepID=UPI002ADED6A9|nr:hypothetical protein [Lamprobacter modestohalophilus]MEA1052053.1 hypothetical protein [Lamprobacter modestohalophilus]
MTLRPAPRSNASATIEHNAAQRKASTNADKGRPGSARRGCAQQGCCAQASKDGFTASPAGRYPAAQTTTLKALLPLH